MSANGIFSETSSKFRSLQDLGGFNANLGEQGAIQGIFVGIDCDITFVDTLGLAHVFTGCKAGSVLPIRPKTISALSVVDTDKIIILY